MSMGENTAYTNEWSTKCGYYRATKDALEQYGGLQKVLSELGRVAIEIGTKVIKNYENNGYGFLSEYMDWNTN